MTEQDDLPANPDRKARQRIAKVMARAGLCSRRDAETWIVDGRVSVNGTVLTSPAIDVTPDDAILIDGTPIPLAERTRLFLFHKPRGLVTSDRDPEGRTTVIDFLRVNWREGPRVVTVGRLDINTEGLLLLTNDGGLARVLELPQTGWIRRYRVRAKGEANPATLDALAAGLTIEGVTYAGIEAKLDRVQGANCWLTMGLREGKNREIKRVLEHIGLEVNRLIRISYGPFQLLDLPEGAVEEVRSRVLRDQLGVKLAAQAGVTFDVADTPPQTDRRPERPSSGDRPQRRRTGERDDRPHAHKKEREDALPPKRERPLAGTRKHVSRLRATETNATGPRKRIERSDTQDRRARTIKVERLVPTQPPSAASRRPRTRPGDPDTRPRSGRFDDERRDIERKSSREGSRPNRDGGRRDEARPPRRDGRNARGRERPDAPPDPWRGATTPASRRHASPSALGKRERMSRSGAPRDQSRGDRNPDRESQGARAKGDTGQLHQSRSPDDSGHRAPRERAQVARPGADRRGRRPPGAFAEHRPDRERFPKSTSARPGDAMARHGKGTGKLKAPGRPTGAASRKPNTRKPDRPGAPPRPRGRPPRGGKPKR